ncbi:uncharacterized protein LAJ45_05227 [Morchella importuna]|uniref:Tctex-1 n=1 Tax=Morchella conica CCBAS932 TaxID=1392247 RepID=A0A3N4KYM5_9PEZI|nr:uncharacterized protein LAJ45_05227 [Morchella importuna]KAH8150531.1 hypothetical protein LAJ45_05227 [Morchella importuna]RPB14519.1 hypothetical protein P167DRAFT_533947 [Morchella conica CCBAS932]
MSDPKFPNLSNSTPPVPTTRLKQICNDACFAALEKVEAYEHSRTESWNTSIINHILRALISESIPSSAVSSTSSSSPFKFAVNSTIIQHLTSRQALPSTSTGTGDADNAGSELVSGRGGSDSSAGVGRRGMHSACGAYWNNERDGMWSFKYETKGMDVVISVIWIAV